MIVPSRKSIKTFLPKTIAVTKLPKKANKNEKIITFNRLNFLSQW